MNWKEQFDKSFKPGSNCQRHWSDDPSLSCTCDSDEANDAYIYGKVKDFISTEIIEKLMADIKRIAHACEIGEESCESVEKELRKEWL